MAATFIDTQIGLARRLFHNATAREQATIYAPEARNRCGEEILNEREIVQGGVTLCRLCAGDRYYQPVSIACALAGDDVSFA
jgi:hypothetical protein